MHTELRAMHTVCSDLYVWYNAHYIIDNIHSIHCIPNSLLYTE